MRINIVSSDYIALLVMGIICAVVFMACGIMLVVTKNTNLISKDGNYKSEKLFALIYGWIYIVSAALIIGISVLSFILTSKQLLLFLIMGIVVITTLLIQFMLNKKFKIKK